MRRKLAWAAAQSMGLFWSSEAFTPSSIASRKSRILTSAGVGGVGDWENDDFLSSLSGKNPAAEELDLPEGSIEGAELSEEMKRKMREDDENSGGGSRFRELMEKASKRAVLQPPPSLKNPFADNPYAGIEGLDPAISPAAAPTAAAAPFLENMTVEQQAQMFRAMMMGQQPPPIVEAAAVHSQPVRPEKPDRRAGRNRDADAIQNTADIYFAQLKRDSTVRGIARLRGDDDKANAVFKDEKIAELNNMIAQNPHLAGKREEEKKLIETAAEEMLALHMAQDARNRSDKKSTGMNYKKKLALRRGVSAGGEEASVAPMQPPVQLQAPVPPAAVVPTTPAQPAVDTIPLPLTPKPAEGPVLAVTPESTKPQQVVAATPEATKSSTAPPQQSTTSITASSSPDEIRKGIRTLMGLILKHRGGPGFGAGGLKGAEIGQFEQILQQVTALLEEEARAHATGPSAQVSPAVVVAAPAAAPATATVPITPSGTAQVESMLACIEGAILMYRNSPAELKEGVLMTVRAALLSAVGTCNKAIGQNEGIPTTGGAGSSVDSMLACVEGAILMYRNSPPELQQTVLLTVRAALLSAIGTCNKIIAENDVQNFQSYQEATAGMDLPASGPKPTQFYEVQTPPDKQAKVAPTDMTMPKPTQFYDVVEYQLPDEPAATAVATMTNDANSVLLENIYDKLQAAAGNGKMGLRTDLTSEDASDLAESIVEMRSILMDELMNGIPEAPIETSTAPPSGEPSKLESTASIYQKMLAKARVDKASNP